MPKKVKKRLSQKRIAVDLGVSQTLVSMVLNGRTEGIAKDSYDRIWSYALENGYSPRGMKLEAGMPGGMAMGMETVGYILRAPLRLANKSNFFSHVHQGLHDYLTENWAKTVFLGSEDLIQPKDLEQFRRVRKSMHGLVIMGEMDSKLVEKLADIFPKVVYLSASLPGVCHSVSGNDVEAAEQLVEHLVDYGHEHFAWLGGSPGTKRNLNRLNAVKSALAKRGLSLPDERQVITNSDGADWREGHGCAEKILALKTGPRPTAWICLNALMARGAINALLRNGLQVAKDVSVAAIDCTRVRESEWPTLTASAAQPEEMGRLAAKLILDDAESSYFQDIVVPATFFKGESTGPVSSVDGNSSQPLERVS
ncbi:LacI family DNA-binding transcriptional regulator [Rubellicoccus peritrichatus]|uniref:LacI family DNA-binding transcriptional regulator n=1 Tax=Rubellicoccus peritrichatus TaxID=3080537 RepID=A0AAQ3LBE3_9BACT|nr:LacI family DNA-binding transcriptional regulator [Puniceicoccus sp. CR14]WOO41227.1 LacI family DNA-binding transcriptional regulator [Puniceicoccus sp. CR14]